MHSFWLRRSLATAANLDHHNFPIERLFQSVINPSICTSLRQNGYVVIDNIFGEPTASLLRDELYRLNQSGSMHPNCTHLVVPSGNTELIMKHSIQEAELQIQSTQNIAPMCSILQNDSTLRTMLNVHIPSLRLQSQAIKLQWNSGNGGCFPMHFDTDASLDGRKISAIVYLNPDWSMGHGGHLRLYPFPIAKPIDIEPVHDRMVLFSSQRMLHRVLPSYAERCCFTIWISEGTHTVGDATLFHRRRKEMDRSRTAENERQQLREALIKAMNRPLTVEEVWDIVILEEVRKHAIKWVYRREWSQSIEESHAEGASKEKLLDVFWKEVDVIERALKPLLPTVEQWVSDEKQQGIGGVEWW